MPKKTLVLHFVLSHREKNTPVQTKQLNKIVLFFTWGKFEQKFF
jgi:hypothetical protein